MSGQNPGITDEMIEAAMRELRDPAHWSDAQDTLLRIQVERVLKAALAGRTVGPGPHPTAVPDDVRWRAWEEFLYPRAAVGDLAEPRGHAGFDRAMRVINQWLASESRKDGEQS